MSEPSPELPLRLRAVRKMPMTVFALASVSALVAMIVVGAAAAGYVVLCVLAMIICLIFAAKPKVKGDLSDNWNIPRIETSDDGFTITRHATRWRDMSPANMPSLWLMPFRFPYVCFTLLPLLAVIHDLAYGDVGPLENAMELALISVLAVGAMVVVTAIGVVALKRYDPSRIVFTHYGIGYEPPVSGMSRSGFYSHGDLFIARFSIQVVHFGNDAIKIVGSPFLGIVPLHIRIPEPTEAITRRVAEWCQRYKIRAMTP